MKQIFTTSVAILIIGYIALCVVFAENYFNNPYRDCVFSKLDSNQHSKTFYCKDGTGFFVPN